MQEAGGMTHSGFPNIGKEGGMSQTGIRMMQIPGRKTGNAGKVTL